MDQIKLEELAVAYPDQEDLVQVYKAVSYTHLKIVTPDEISLYVCGV